MNRNNNSEQEIPYDILRQFGLTEEMISDLPEHVLDEIKAGKRSPLLPVSVKTEDGAMVRCRTRFFIAQTDEGKTDVIFIPQLISSKLTAFDSEKQTQLQAGKAIVDVMATYDGREVMGYHQLDTLTNQVMSVPTPVIGRNMQIIADHYHLNASELNCLRGGQPLTIIENDNPLTIGIDLTDITGIRSCKGDEKQWREQPKHGWERFNFGVFGCWAMDESGNLDYIPEEEYTDEIWDELSKKSNARRQQSPLKM